MVSVSRAEREIRKKILELNVSITSPKEEKRRDEIENFRITSAIKVIKALNSCNVGLVADTGTGKTIISFLVFLLKNKNNNFKTLFLAPQRFLVNQHNELLKNVVKGNTPVSSVIVGGTKKRNWSDKNIPIIFATPQTFEIALKNKTANIEDFNLIIFDELHHGQGNYSYVPIAKLAKKAGVRMLPISASPGGSKEKIAKIKETFDIKQWVSEELKMPEKVFDLSFVKLDGTLERINNKFLSMFGSAEKQLRELGFLKKEDNKRKKDNQLNLFNDAENNPQKTNKKVKILSQKEFVNLKKEIDSSLTINYEAISLYSIYGKLRYSFVVCITESYHTFLKFIEKLEKKDIASQTNTKKRRRTAICRFLRHKKMKEIVRLARKNLEKHPKVVSLIKITKILKKDSKNGIIFVREKETGKHLKEVLTKHGISCEVLFGGKDKNRKQQKNTIEMLKNRSIDFIIATSVLKEGLNIPEIDIVIHYSLSPSGIAVKQGNGRVGRTRPGKIYFVILNHFLDIRTYWSAFTQIKIMEKVIREEIKSSSLDFKTVSVPVT